MTSHFANFWNAVKSHITGNRFYFGHVRAIFIKISGGKTIVSLRNVGLFAGISILIFAVSLAWFGPVDDRTFYHQNSQNPKPTETRTDQSLTKVSNSVADLFANSARRKKAEEQSTRERSRRRVAIKYLAPQVVGHRGKGPTAIRSGTKMLGFLLNPIDTRASSAVRVRIVRGGSLNGVEIEQGSILTGQYHYKGSGNLVFISFSNMDTPDGDQKRISAQALDSESYAPGVSGEIHSDAGLKEAASLGLTMLSGMADIMVEKESMGPSQNGIQAKSTMKNALLHGASRSAQEQTGRIQGEINSTKDYVLISEGKEVIIELIEDFK